MDQKVASYNFTNNGLIMKKLLCLILFPFFTLIAQESEAIKLECYIDEELLVGKLLTCDVNSQEITKKDIKAFQEELAATHPGKYNSILFDIDEHALPEFMKIVKNLPTYKKLFLETQGQLAKCQEEWSKNATLSRKIVQDVTGLSIKSEKHVRLEITHPALDEWAQEKNGFTRHVWKIILSSYLDNDCISEALKTFVCDHELNALLQGKTPSSLQEQKEVRCVKALERDWKAFRRHQTGDIVSLAKTLKQKYKITNELRKEKNVPKRIGEVATPQAPVEYIKISFVLDEASLVASLLLNDWSNFVEPYRADVRAFQEHMWSHRKKECLQLANYLPSREGVRAFRYEPTRALDHLVIAAKKLPIFTKLHKQAEERLTFCRTQWEKNYPQCFAIMKEITGIPFQDSFTVHTSHPGVHSGVSFLNGEISWGGKEEFENYTTVYLWHEVMHSYLIKDGFFSHVILELACDNELRFRLSIVTYPPTIGHPYLDALRETIVPQWKKYLLLPKKDIHQFQEEVEVSANNNRYF